MTTEKLSEALAGIGPGYDVVCSGDIWRAERRGTRPLPQSGKSPEHLLAECRSAEQRIESAFGRIERPALVQRGLSNSVSHVARRTL